MATANRMSLVIRVFRTVHSQSRQAWAEKEQYLVTEISSPIFFLTFNQKPFNNLVHARICRVGSRIVTEDLGTIGHRLFLRWCRQLVSSCFWSIHHSLSSRISGGFNSSVRIFWYQSVWARNTGPTGYLSSLASMRKGSSLVSLTRS